VGTPRSGACASELVHLRLHLYSNACYLVTLHLLPLGCCCARRHFPGFSSAFRQMELEAVLPQAAQQRLPSQQQSGGRGCGRGAVGSRVGGRGRGNAAAGSGGGQARGTTGTAGVSDGSHGEGLSSGSDDVPVLGRARSGSDDQQAAGIAAAGIAAAVKQRGKRSQVRLYTFGSSSEEEDGEEETADSGSEAESSESDFSSGEEYAPKRPRPAARLEVNADGSGSSSSGEEEKEEASSGEEAAPAAPPQQLQVRWHVQRQGQGPGRGQGRGRGASSSAAEPARWRRPASHVGLVLDQEALWQALEEGKRCTGLAG